MNWGKWGWNVSLNLKTYVALSFGILIFLLTAFLSFTISSKSVHEVKNQSGNSLSEMAFQMSDKLDSFMWSRYTEIEVLSELETVRETENLVYTQNMLDQLHKSIPSFSWVGLTDEDGIVTAATDKLLIGTDISDRPVFKHALTGPFIGDVHDAVLLSKILPNPGGEPLQFVDISTPVKGSNSEFKGVLAAHLSWEWSNEIKETVLKPLKGKRENIEIFIVSAKDQTVLLGPDSMVGKSLPLDSIKKAKEKENDWQIETWPDGKSYVTGYARSSGYKDYSGLGWTVIARQAEDTAFASASELQQFIMLLGITSALIFAVIGWFAAGRIAEPLGSISAAAHSLKKGKNVRIPDYKGIKDIEVLSDSLRDLIADLQKTEDELGRMEDLAYYDGLTGLPNRFSLYLNMEKAMKKAKAGEESFVILFLDLDGFKEINDSFGHHVGDSVLIEIGKRLMNTVAEPSFVSRYGGDEFVCIIPSKNDPEAFGELYANEMISIINQPIQLAKNEVKVGCSIGCAIWPQDGVNPEDILKLADQALYVSKTSGKNQMSFA